MMTKGDSRPWSALVLGAALLLTAAACGSDSDGGPGGDAGSGGSGRIGGDGGTGGDDGMGGTGGDDGTGGTGGDDGTGGTGGDDNTGGTGGTGGDDNTGGTGGDDGTGGTGGDDNTGGTGGDDNTGGTGPTGCADLPLPGPLADGAWSSGFEVAGLTGPDGIAPRVYDLAPDAGGNLLATGYFSRAGTATIDPLARRNPDGTWENLRSTWETALPVELSAMAPADDRLALATHGRSFPARGEILADTGAGLASVGAFTGQVRELVWVGDVLWAAGLFTLDGTELANLALWDGATWSAPPGGPVDGPVYELEYENGTLLVGGGFTTVGGIPALNIAEWDGTSWTAHDFDLAAGRIYALERGVGGVLYAGGSFFDEVPGRGGIARRIGGAWEFLGGGVASSWNAGVVSDLETHQGQLYVTGCFTHVNGASSDPAAIPARSLARWNGMRWFALDDSVREPETAWFDFPNCGDEGPAALWNMTHQRLLSDGTRLWIAGSFPSVDGVASQGLVACENEAFLPVGEGGQGITGAVTQLAVGGPDCALHAFGAVTHGGAEPTASGLLRRENDGWTALGEALPADVDCTTLAVSPEGEVYLGCETVRKLPWDPALGRLLRLEAGSWFPVAEPHALAPIRDLAFDARGRLWAVGGDGVTGFVARLDDAGFTVVEDGFNGMVRKLAFAPGGPDEEQALVVGGTFTSLDDQPFARVAHLAGAIWSPLGEGLSTTVLALAYGESGIYASTASEGDAPRRILGRWDGAAWVELATPENGLPAPAPETTPTFTTLLERGGQLLAAGYVWPETGGRNAFLWDGERFQSVGGGVAATMVNDLALAPDGLWFGGSIAEVGGDNPIPSVGVARFAWPEPQ